MNPPEAFGHSGEVVLGELDGIGPEAPIWVDVLGVWRSHAGARLTKGRSRRWERQRRERGSQGGAGSLRVPRPQEPPSSA